jgi:hypothetical protein
MFVDFFVPTKVHSRRSLPCFEAASAPFLPPTANRASEKGTTMSALCHDATQSTMSSTAALQQTKSSVM